MPGKSKVAVICPGIRRSFHGDLTQKGRAVRPERDSRNETHSLQCIKGIREVEGHEVMRWRTRISCASLWEGLASWAWQPVVPAGNMKRRSVQAGASPAISPCVGVWPLRRASSHGGCSRAHRGRHTPGLARPDLWSTWVSVGAHHCDRGPVGEG